MGKQQPWWLRSVFFLCFFIPIIAWADGKVFTRATAVANTPDQRALLYFSNGVERLVIETSFVGEGTNFAWVVPLPSVPKIEAVGENFFPSLTSAFQPELIYKTSSLWITLLIVGGLISGSIEQYRKGRLVSWLVATGMILLLAALSIPSFVKARHGGTTVTTPSVTVIEQNRVGIYDTVILSGTNAQELLAWLNSNKFHVPTNALPAISYYAAKKWVFAAAMVHRATETVERSQPHPLAFTFATERPVYPLQLTGVGNDTCSIELFVFGPGRAHANHFAVKHCGAPFTDAVQLENGYPRELFSSPKPGEYRILNPEVAAFAMPSPVATKLVAKLTPDQMQSDAWIEWRPARAEFPTLYSRSALFNSAVDLWFVIVIAGALLIHLAAPKLGRVTAIKSLGVVAALATVCASIHFASAKTTEVHIVRGRWIRSFSDFKQLHLSILMYAEERKSAEPLTLAALTNAVSRDFLGGGINCFTREPLSHRVSPGDITLQETTNGTVVVWYDINSNPHELATFKWAERDAPVTEPGARGRTQLP